MKKQEEEIPEVKEKMDDQLQEQKNKTFEEDIKQLRQKEIEQGKTYAEDIAQVKKKMDDQIGKNKTFEEEIKQLRQKETEQDDLVMDVSKRIGKLEKEDLRD